jgi:hypothetical protein
VLLLEPRAQLGQLQFARPEAYVLVTMSAVRVMEAGAALALIQASGVFVAFSSTGSLARRALNRDP